MTASRTALIFALSALAPTVAAQNLSPLETHLLDEVNLLRADPAAWADILNAERPSDLRRVRLNPNDPTAAATIEALSTLDEAVAAVRSIHGSLPLVELSPGLSRSAADHVRDTGVRGLLGHQGSDGSGLFQRIERYGLLSGLAAENIVYSTSPPRQLVFEQLLDFGVANRGHRWTLLNPAWRYVGIACGPHAVYRTMCVLDFAAGYRDRDRDASAH